MFNELRQMLSEKKAQTGLEYLLIIAGAVVVVVIVGFVLKGAASASSQTVNDQVPLTG